MLLSALAVPSILRLLSDLLVSATAPVREATMPETINSRLRSRHRRCRSRAARRLRSKRSFGVKLDGAMMRMFYIDDCAAREEATNAHANLRSILCVLTSGLIL